MMKKISLLSILYLYATSLTAGVSSGADAIINKVNPKTYIGIEVFDLTSGTVLYQRNANLLFKPASNMKLFSNAAALMNLGPDYEFKNQLSTNASQLKNGLLQGSVYLNLAGDPSFSHQRLFTLFSELQAWPVKHIKGNVVIDSAHTTITPMAPGWITKDTAYSYGAPLTPLMVDANRLLVTVNPSDKPNSPAVIEIHDPGHSITLTNKVVTKSSNQGCGVGFHMDNNNHLLVQGCIGVGSMAVQQNMAIRNPLLYARGLIKHVLTSMGIALDGDVVLGSTPAGTLLIATDNSKPISQLMADTLKPSDNLYADSLFLHTAATLKGAPTDWAESQTLVKDFLEKQTNIPLKNAVLIDGSGLSRDDRLTPHQTVSLLKFLYERFPLSYEYIAALPVSGRDGTLNKRLKKPNEQDLIRAKTGTMMGIWGLSGYLYTKNSHTLAFSIFVNRVPHVNMTMSGRYLIDMLCDYFLKQEPSDRLFTRLFWPNKRLQFQQHLTKADLQRGEQARWRRLEINVKQALRGQSVVVLFHHNTLILQDKQAQASSVLHALESVRKKYPFAMALFDANAPDSTTPSLLWAEYEKPLNTSVKRIWTIKPVV